MEHWHIQTHFSEEKSLVFEENIFQKILKILEGILFDDRPNNLYKTMDYQLLLFPSQSHL